MHMNTTTSEKAGVTRGDVTRKALVTAAISIFGRDGFDAASTRSISRAAGVNQALIGYHFGGKPGLYYAALQHIANSVSALIGPLLGDIESELPVESTDIVSEGEAGRVLELLQRVTDAFVQVLTSDKSADWARLILREQQDPSEGFDILYDGIMHRLLSVTTRLVGLARRGVGSEEESKLLAVTILGQALVFRAARTAVMREMGWKGLVPDRVESIKAILRRNVAAVLAVE
jgi:AcrR family transcriptional regulator